MDIREVQEICYIINNKIYETVEGIQQEFPLTVNSDGYVIAIDFMGSRIWCDDNDEREYIENEDKYEDLDFYLCREINIIIDELKKIKL